MERHHEAAVQDLTWQQFRKLIAGLESLDYETVVAAGIIRDKTTDWIVFNRRPTDLFMALPDDLAAKLFDLAMGASL